MSGTESFFHAMAPVLVGNMLTVTFVYAFVSITQKERVGEEEGRGTYLWLIILVNFFMLYGLYTWGVYPLKNEPPFRDNHMSLPSKAPKRKARPRHVRQSIRSCALQS